MKERTRTESRNETGADLRIPVTLLTGFLGAGKTTLLNNLLRHPEMAGAAVLINEFGAVGIDHHLVDRVDETMVILDSGCICCSVQGDLVKALKNLARRSSLREIPPVTRVVIETTGLADPVPVISTLTREWFVAARYQCDGVITAVSATHALGQLAKHREAVQQVAMADRLLITKCDLADIPSRVALGERLDALNPGATRFEVCQGRVAPQVLFGCGIYKARTAPTEVAAWLGGGGIRARETDASVPSPRRGGRTGRGLVPAKGHHDDGVTSFVVTFPGPVPWYGFAVAMGRILESHGPKILRVKGLMEIEGDPQPRVIHCVQEVAYPPVSLAGWPEQSPFEDRRGRLVFIVHDLPRGEVDAIRDALMQAADDGRAAGVRPGLAFCPLPTRCWLACKVKGGARSELQVDGWTVQGVRLRAK